MSLQALRHKFIGDRAFYRHVLAIGVPLMLQQVITNFVNMLDNIMVGRIGTEQMAGVSIVNQLFFVFNLCIFGGLAGVGIFTTQFFGSRDEEGIRFTVRFKLWTILLICGAAFLIFLKGGDLLIGAYLTGDAAGGSLEATRQFSHIYLNIMLLGVIPFALMQVYATTLRECGESLVPMAAGIISTLVNLVLNYALIYGRLGAPCLGVAGAAWATVIARVAEMVIVAGYAHLRVARFPFLRGLYRSLRVPRDLVRRFTVTGLPLLANEALWSASVAGINQCYSTRGLDAIAGMNIATTLTGLFVVSVVTIGNITGIVVGHALGAGDMAGARDADNKMFAFAVVSSLFFAALEMVAGPFFPRIYNTTPEARQLATTIIVINACFMPQNSFINCAYFTLRCGGKTIITFLFDSVYACLLIWPLAILLSRFTPWSVPAIYVAVQLPDLLKCLIGFLLVKSGRWMNRIV